MNSHLYPGLAALALLLGVPQPAAAQSPDARATNSVPAPPPADTNAVVVPPSANEANAAEPAKAGPPEGPARDPVLEQHAKGKRLFDFHADNLDLKTALALFARANHLNIVPDNDLTGMVTLDVRELPLEEMMEALLEAADCTWFEKNGLIRVRNTETKLFKVDYLRLSRKNTVHSTANLNSGSSQGGGGSGGGGGGGGSSGGGGGGMSTTTGGGGSSVNLSADNPVDFWTELTTEIGTMLTPAGKSTFSKTAGLLQVTDRPSALKRVECYLKASGTSIHRQVEIDARIYDITLNDQFQFGINWNAVATAVAKTYTFNWVGATAPQSIGTASLIPSAGTMSFISTNPDVPINATLQALKMQGNVEVITKPRIRTMNNQTAMIKVGEERAFFSTSTTYLQGTAQSAALQQSQVQMVTFGTILSLTPQISDDGWILLDISPVLSRQTGVETTGSPDTGQTTAPDMETKQATTLVRVRDGTTVVMGGLIQTENSKSENKIPLLGDIPYLGKWLFTGTFNYKRKAELVIFVTPHIVPENEGDAINPEPLPVEPRFPPNLGASGR